MHKLFIPVPGWLDRSMEVMETHQRSSLPPVRLGSDKELEQALEFQLLCFESLYRLGLSDRQTVELTGLIILLHKEHGSVAMIPITEQGIKQWQVNNPGKQGPGWFTHRSRFFFAFENLDEFFQEWLVLHLSKNDTRNGVAQKFWSGTDDWIRFFLNPEQKKEFDQLTQVLRCLFAQHCFKVPITGIWDTQSRMVCKFFQMRLPKSVLPWKNGTLDGFTYKVVAQAWKRKKGLKGGV